MCIRDSGLVMFTKTLPNETLDIIRRFDLIPRPAGVEYLGTCLLYTSDAADERSSVDLGGRRIIKKKKYSRIA